MVLALIANAVQVIAHRSQACIASLHKAPATKRCAIQIVFLVTKHQVRLLYLLQDADLQK